MKCYNCGFENKPGVSFCHQCGVNLKNDDADVLNKEFKINKKRKAYPAPPENSIKAKLNCFYRIFYICLFNYFIEI